MAANIYNATFLNFIGSFTSGALTIVPKTRDGQPVPTYVEGTHPFDTLADLRVDADPSTPGTQELKEWEAVLDYVRTFEDTDANGIPDVPQAYAGPLGRQERVPSWSPLALLGGSRISWGATGIVVALLTLVTGLGALVWRWLRRR